MLKLLPILIMSVACGYRPDFVNNDTIIPHSKISTNTDFIAYISEFEDYYKIKTNVPIAYGDMDINYAGICNVWADGYREILVNKLYWIFYSEAQREILIFHEMGHCVFNLKHNDQKSLGCPSSIMKSYMFSEYEAQECYEKNKFYYLDQLIGE